jgi:hypothetical protein
VLKVGAQYNLFRVTFAPHMGESIVDLKEISVFEFPSSQPESLVWQRFFPKNDDVHWLGNRMESSARRIGKSKRYLGFVCANALTIRAFKTAAGFGFSVQHAPEQGLQHVHIEFNSEKDGVAPNKSQRNELRLALVQRIFTEKIEFRQP